MDVVARMLARERFAKARRRAVQEEWVARVAHRWRGLLPYDPLEAALLARPPLGPPRLSTVRLDQIVGSVGHSRDFTLNFWPRSSVSPERWVLVDVAMNQPAGVPPIEVLQIGDKFFVADGNHRVSVARANGMHEIEAYVTVVAPPADDPTDRRASEVVAPAAHVSRLAVPGWLRGLWDRVEAFIDDLLTA